MSAGGAGIPRLQDLSYLEVAAGQVAAGASFEQVRRSVVSRAAEIARENDTDGSFNDRKWDATLSDGTKHVHNTVDVLKELMRLGWLERHVLPSGPSSAYLHANATFELTEPGHAWTEQLHEDRRNAYNLLLGSLIEVHPQLEAFLRAVGARADSTANHLTIPHLRWDGAAHPNDAAYLDALINTAIEAAESGTVSWTADRATIDTGVRDYVARISARLEARKKPQTRKQFVNTCDEAITKVAFAAAGCTIDYISVELLRRWTRFMGVVNFSYYASEPYALRLWATGVVGSQGSSVEIDRHVGPQIRRDALDAVLQVWQDRGSATSSGMYMPIFELRAAVCWQQRISDDEFDKAIGEALSGIHSDLGFRLHLDQASMRATPASTRPLVLPTASGHRRVFNVVTIIPNNKEQS